MIMVMIDSNLYSLLTLVGVLFCPFPISSKNRGAPVTACRSLMPAHGFSPQKTSTLYEIVANPLEIYPNQTITVSIQVISRRNRFKGFILQGKSTEYWQKLYYPAIGSFKFTEGTLRLNCFHGEYNTITHSHAQHTDIVKMEWIPPYKFVGQVTFVATVVKTFKVYWTKVYSNPVHILDYP